MATQATSQKIGTHGQRVVETIISRTREWIPRAQVEDFGIDLEIELSVPEVLGDLIKIQIKSKDGTTVENGLLKIQVEKKYLRFAENCRLPVILVVVDTEAEQAWYLWLQEWLVGQRRNGKAVAELPNSSTVSIPETETLESGLKGRLKDIAQWRNETQLVIALADTLRTAMATKNEKVVHGLAALIESVDIAFHPFPAEVLMEILVDLSARPYMLWESSEIARLLAWFCRGHGKTVTKEQILKMVAPGDWVSRAGMGGLGVLYDDHFSHVQPMDLPTAFDKIELEPVAAYCRIREKHPGINSVALASGKYDCTVGDITIDFESVFFMNKWANRGDSAFLDYMHKVGEKPSE